MRGRKREVEPAREKETEIGGKYCGERRWSFLLVDGHRPTWPDPASPAVYAGVTSHIALSDKRTCACVRARPS